MPQLSLTPLKKILSFLNSGWLYIVAGAVGGLVVLIMIIIYLQLNKTPKKLVTAADGPKLQDLSYLSPRKVVTTFVWQPESQPAVTISGTNQVGDVVPNSAANPGTALINEGFRMVKLGQNNLEVSQNQTGFQKDNEVCVVTASVANVNEDKWVDNPEFIYELSCGLLP